MEAKQNNKFDMYRAVQGVLKSQEHQNIWEDIPGFNVLQTDFNTEVTLITTLSNSHGRRKTGVAEDKVAARLSMCKTANVVAGQVAAYAHRTAKHELLTRVDTSLSILAGGRGQDSIDKCKDILAAATANLAAL